MQQSIKEQRDVNKDIRDKYQLQLKRRATMYACVKQSDLQLGLKDDYAVIFPTKPLTAWDKLPRFTFLDTDFEKLQLQQTVLHKTKQAVKSIMVGSPVRVVQEGGILAHEKFAKKRIV